MRLAALRRQSAELARVVREASDVYGAGRRATVRRARHLRRAGWEYGEALKEGLLDPSVPEARGDALISRHARRAAQSRLNPIALEPFTEQKVIFHSYCEAVGIPAPRVFGGAGRAGGWSATTGRAVDDRDAFAAMVRDELPAEFVVKPAEGLLGLGVRLIDRSGDELGQVGRGTVDPRVLHDELCADPDFDLFLVQQRLHDHRDLQDLSPGRTLQTLRLTTLVREDGGVTILHSVLKLGLSGAAADNYRAGATGNGLCDVNLTTGRLGPLQLPGPGGHGSRATPEIPGTDRLGRGPARPVLRRGVRARARGGASLPAHAHPRLGRRDHRRRADRRRDQQLLGCPLDADERRGPGARDGRVRVLRGGGRRGRPARPPGADQPRAGATTPARATICSMMRPAARPSP